MCSPIEMLRNNIVNTFENISQLSIAIHLKAVEAQQLNPEIDYDNKKEPVKGPHADPVTRKIYLQETYLEHLWSFIYSVFVIFEEGVQNKLSKGTFKDQIDFDSDILKG